MRNGLLVTARDTTVDAAVAFASRTHGRVWRELDKNFSSGIFTSSTKKGPAAHAACVETYTYVLLR